MVEAARDTMKTRTKIILTIVAAVAYWAIIQAFLDSSRHASSVGLTVNELQVQYASNNDQFFQGKLPKVAIDFLETNPNYLAATRKESGGFRISFNPVLAKSARLDDYLLLHEACHIATWEDSAHGVEWRACMLKLDMQDAFREIFIYSFQEDKP